MKRIHVTSVAVVIAAVLIVITLLYPQSIRYTGTLLGVNLIVEICLLLYMNWKEMDI